MCVAPKLSYINAQTLTQPRWPPIKFKENEFMRIMYYYPVNKDVSGFKYFLYIFIDMQLREISVKFTVLTIYHIL